MSHGVRQAEHAGADHRRDIVERHVPPFGAARGVLRRIIDDLKKINGTRLISNTGHKAGNH
jgi:hypothetical protein